jgi:hypothetical protein
VTRKSDIQDRIKDLQSRLDILNRVPTDKFSIGTVVVFSSNGGSHWYYLKTGEETWISFNKNLSGVEKDLANWILDGIESNVGYFEVYELKVQPNPFFASS